MKDEFEYETATGYRLAGIKFTAVSEWEGLAKWKDKQGRVLIVAPQHGLGFASAFDGLIGRDTSRPAKLRIIAGSPSLLAEIVAATGDRQAEAAVSAERHALQQIREAGYNEHPTAVWMQKVAAHAMEPNKFPHPGEQPKL